ncbi:hypothetical protein [Streptomyces sp. NPDC058280]|uniref:hypothetical protein n=1 Tax=Streptomyces sp. NPDC058280 TaxID=3346419 RepID=UPI0036EDA04F
MELKASLDDAVDQIKSLTTTCANLERERDSAYRFAKLLQGDDPSPGVVFVGTALVDGLKDTIVSQAREIARLKGESE